ncbi:conserved hypothetical protein [Pseudomonas sp. IT-P44]|uniref:DUF4238 domain-containing protein n=1 Tax=Pseudomonas sp. IT-P44 TaxID=3026451 RepID=UPI0039DF6BBD
MDVIKTNEAGKPAKRRNHTVPKAILKNWLLDEEGDPHHLLLACSSAEVRKHVGREAGFAITDWRYVPVDDRENAGGHRDESLEDWFSKGENYLASVTQKIRSGDSAISQGEFSGLIGAAVALGFRSSYEYGLKEKLFLKLKPDLTANEACYEVVQYFKTLYEKKISQFEGWDFSFLINSEVKLIIGDRPLFDMTLHRTNTKLLTIPLAPNLLMVGIPPKTPGKQSFEVISGTRSLFEQTNAMTTKLAREFIVGSSVEELSALLPMFEPEAFNSRKAEDSLVAFSDEGEVARRKIYNINQ